MKTKKETEMKTVHVQKNVVQKDVIEIIKKLMNDIENKLPKRWRKKHGKAFADTKIYVDKEMKTVTNFDESKGWTGRMSHIVDKKDDDVLVLVTYDGAGYEYWSSNGGGEGYLLEQLRKIILKKYGDKVWVEEYTTWAFEVYFEEVVE